jgi:serine/threonine protein kinase
MPAVTDNWVGARLAGGRYRVDELVGGGGMALIYRAYDRHLDTPVAVKVPRGPLLSDPEFARRFPRELRALVRLSHPHVVKMLDVGEHDGVPFGVMQFLSGGCLLDRLPEGKPTKPAALAGWLPDVAKALDFIHSKGYVHRDVKPENVLFDEHGHSYLSDFGIAKALAGSLAAQTAALTAAGTAIGTPAYMAPELIMGQEYDGRVDQYALAATVYRALAGRGLFEGAPPAAILVKQTTEQPPPLHSVAPGVGEGLADAVMRGLSKDPRRRFASCVDFAHAVLSSPQAAAGDNTGVSRRPRGTTTNESATKSFTCPKCGKRVRFVPDANAKIVQCPSCGQSFRTKERTQSTTGTASHGRAETQPVRRADARPISQLDADSSVAANRMRKAAFLSRLKELVAKLILKERSHPRLRALLVMATLAFGFSVACCSVVMDGYDMGRTNKGGGWMIVCFATISFLFGLAFTVPDWSMRRNSAPVSRVIRTLEQEYPDLVERTGVGPYLRDKSVLLEAIKQLESETSW